MRHAHPRPPRPVDLTEEEGCYQPLLLVGVETAVLGGELLCHRFGDDIDVVGHLSIGTYHRPQDLAPLPVGAEFGFEAAARVPTKTAVEFLGPVMVVLVDLPLTVVDDRVGLAVAVLCVLVAGREGLDVYEGLLVGERAGTAEAAAVEGEVGDDALQDCEFQEHVRRKIRRFVSRIFSVDKSLSTKLAATDDQRFGKE